MKAPPVSVASRQAGGGAVVRLLTGENRPGFCKLSKSRINRDKNGREYVGRLGASAGAGWGACWPGAVLGWPFGGGVRSIYDFDGKTAGKRAQVLIFSPFLPSCPSSPSSDVLAFSCWLCLFDLGGQAGGIGAAGGVSVWPGCWACRALLRQAAGLAALVPCLLSVSPAGRAGAVCAGAGAGAGHGRRFQANRLANQQNAQRFNKKCSIMTKMMGCILYFLRYKYVCFGVK